MTTVFWVNKTNLTEKAIQSLKEKLGEITIVQLSELPGEFLPAMMLKCADVLAYQNGSLPPDLVDLIKSRPYILHVIDFDFEFVKWDLEGLKT